MALIREMSDLHNEFYAGHKDQFVVQELPTDHDTILVLAGDIDVGIRSMMNNKNRGLKDIYDPNESFLSALSKRFKHIIYVFGNHEFWGENISFLHQKVRDKIKEAGIRNITILEKQSIELDGFLFVGATLWTDFDKANPNYLQLAPYDMKDYLNKIKMGDKYVRFSSYKALHEHHLSREYIQSVASENKDKKIIVVTHHAPSFQSIHENFRGGDMLHYAPYYHSNLSKIMKDNTNIKFWFHGHTHNSADYTIGETRVICNPNGYYKEESNEEFNPTLLINTDNYE